MSEAAAAVAGAGTSSAGDVIGGIPTSGGQSGESTEARSPESTLASKPARPDWLAERDARFFDAEKGVDPAKIYESYTNAQQLIGRRFSDLSPAAKAQLADILRPEVGDSLKETLKGELTGDEEFIKGLLDGKLPKAPEAYEAPATLAEKGINLDTEHPVWQAAVEIGKKHNLSQDALGEMIGLLPQVLEGYLVPPVEDRIKAFGPDFAPRAQATVNVARAVAARVAGSDAVAKEVNQGLVGALLAELKSPEALKGLELLCKATGEKPMPGSVPAPATAVTRESLDSMMRDPKYYSPLHRDPNFVRQVEQGFKQLYPSDTL